MQKTKMHKVRLTEKQAESLAILKSYDVNVSQFIRSAIKEKLQRDTLYINIFTIFAMLSHL
jgi:hypothetical protein